MMVGIAEIRREYESELARKKSEDPHGTVFLLEKRQVSHGGGKTTAKAI